MKFKFFTSCILSMLLVGSSVVAYAETMTSVVPSSIAAANELTTHTNCSDPTCFEKLNSGILTRALLLSQESTFNGEGNYSFRYDSGYLRLYIENTGSSAFNYTVKYPCGCKLVSSDLKPGKHDLFDKFDPELHGSGYGHTPVGTYSIYVYNDDGSRGSIKMAARSIEK